jgi:hypothetical protein
MRFNINYCIPLKKTLVVVICFFLFFFFFFWYLFLYLELDKYPKLPVCVFYFADSHWILLSADSEGFIPLTFTATQTVIVRDGLLCRSNVSRDLLSHSQDPEVFGDLTTQSFDTTGSSNHLDRAA